MTRLAITIAALIAAARLNAAEHPACPPNQPDQTQQAAPQGQPAQPPGAAPLGTRRILKTYETVVREHVKAESDEPFVAHDDKLNKEWKLKLLRVHTDRIVSLGNNRFFACSDFKSVNSKDKLDLDFVATRSPDGTWKMEKVLIHKVNGRPRYTWNEKNEMVPLN